MLVELIRSQLQSVDQTQAVQTAKEYFDLRKSDLYDNMYMPSDSEVEVKTNSNEKKKEKENFELLKLDGIGRYHTSKLPDNQKQMIAEIAQQLTTYPNSIEGLNKFKVTKEEFESNVKDALFDDFTEFIFSYDIT